MLRTLLFIAAVALLLASGALASSPHDELRGVRREIRAKQTLLKKTKKVEAAVSQELQNILRNLARKESELKQLDRDLSTVEGAIARTGQEVARVTEEAQVKQRQIERRLTSLYKAGELGAVRMFFSAESFPQMAENIRYMRSVLEHDKRIFGEYTQKLEELSQLKVRLEQDATRKERLKGTIASKKSEIEEEKQKKASLLSKVQGDRKSYEKSIRELSANAARLQNMLNRLEAESRRRAFQKQEKSGSTRKPPPELPPVPDRGFASQKGRLPMPVRGQVVEGFGKHKHPQFNSYTFTKGLFIAAAAGSEIKSIYEGTVIFADYYKGYGNMVILDHGGGYFTLYAHAARINRKVGSEVSRGDTLAVVGDVDSTRGPVLYFEVRHQGKPQDPAGWIR
ncbi:MAG: murein hydrolase activator EnvC [Porticoccaceae bacterium]